MAKIRAILFDLDGTLRDTQELIYTSLDHAFQTFGVRSPSRDELAPYIHHHTFIREKFLPDITLDAFEKVYGEKIDELLPTVELYEHASQTLKVLKSQGYKLAVVTAAMSAPQDVKDYGIDEYLDTLVSAGDISAHKPDPEGTLLALDRLDVKASEAIMVGDMATDIKAAKAAGLAATVGITHGIGTRESLEEVGADYIIDSLAELIGVMTTLAEK